MNCQRVQDSFIDYQDGTLPDADAQRLQAFTQSLDTVAATARTSASSPVGTSTVGSSCARACSTAPWSRPRSIACAPRISKI